VVQPSLGADDDPVGNHRLAVRQAGVFGDEADLWKADLQRVQLVTNGSCKNGETAGVLLWGFMALKKPPHKLQELSDWQVKHFYDYLCVCWHPWAPQRPLWYSRREDGRVLVLVVMDILLSPRLLNFFFCFDQFLHSFSSTRSRV
jgi:hypothetical protein